MSLYNTLRPKLFKEVYGNELILKSLSDMIKNNNVPNAILLQGESGCGKTTIARILARKLGAKGIDLVEVNASNMRGIDTARAIVGKSVYAPMISDSCVYIMDESHQLTGAAQEALLKVVEDCPDYLYFIFCTTNPAKIIKTLKNRCTIFNIRPLDRSEMCRFIYDNYDKATKKELHKRVISAIAGIAEGCPRTAIICIEKIMLLDDVDLMLHNLEEGVETESPEVVELCRLVIAKGRYEEILNCYEKLNMDEDKLKAIILGYLSACIRKSINEKEGIRFAEKMNFFIENESYLNKKAVFIKALFESSLI